MSKLLTIVFPVPTNDHSLLFAFYNKNFPNSPWTKTYWNKLFTKNKGSVIIGLKNEHRYVGLIIGETSSQEPLCTIITAIAIDSKFRRFGHGTFLVKRFLEIVFNETLSRKIILHFRDSNKTSLANFYTNLGFKNCHKEGFYSNNEVKHYLELTRKDFLILPPKNAKLRTS